MFLVELGFYISKLKMDQIRRVVAKFGDIYDFKAVLNSNYLTDESTYSKLFSDAILNKDSSIVIYLFDNLSKYVVTTDLLEYRKKLSSSTINSAARLGRHEIVSSIIKYAEPSDSKDIISELIKKGSDKSIDKMDKYIKTIKVFVDNGMKVPIFYQKLCNM